MRRGHDRPYVAVGDSMAKIGAGIGEGGFSAANREPALC